MKRTNRGFGIYSEFKDTRGCQVRVQESSAACERCVWVFCSNTDGVYTDRNSNADVSPHLTAAQARRLAKALLKFANGEP